MAGTARPELWTQARSLADLGQCVALWLEGRLPPRPTSMHCGDVSDETARLVSVLARLNRGGRFITEGSQPARTPTQCAYGGYRPWQRAAVMGYVSPQAIGLVRTTLRSLPGVEVRISPPGAPHSEPTQVTCMTDRRVEIRLFGGVLSQQEIAAHFGPIAGWSDHPGLHDDVVRALQNAYQVSAVDTIWGRNNVLWPALTRLA